MLGWACAKALEVASSPPSSAAQVSIFLEAKTFSSSGMYRANRGIRAALAPGSPYSRFGRQRHVVSAAVVWREP